MDPPPYFITFRTHGTWLHGDARGSVDRSHNAPNTPRLDPNPSREAFERELMEGAPVVLSPAHRTVVEATIREVCAHRGWTLHVMSVRTNHTHAVVRAGRPPERVMNDFKAYATRRLVEAGLIERGAKVWSRHGSTIYLNTPAEFEGAVDYVLNRQDLPEQSTPNEPRVSKRPDGQPAC